jgi:hypothetical protein
MTMNPFKPTAGKLPPILIGRQNIISSFQTALDDGAGAPGRLMLISGQRGFGKTVMLTEIAKIAKKQDWLIVSETASTGLIERLTSQLQNNVKLSKVNIQPSVSIGGVVSAQIGGASLESKTQALTLRQAIEARLRKIKPGCGILFTIDEAQAASSDELIALATTYQQVLTDLDLNDEPDAAKQGIALVIAALPSLTDEVLQKNVLTFLRRSMQFTLDNVYDSEVAEAYRQTVKNSGKTISNDTSQAAAKAAAGYPYMIQLIGYYMWQHAQLEARHEITTADVQYAIEISAEAFENAVCAPEFNSLTAAQKDFLLAMAACPENVVNVSDISAHVKKSASWTSKYRKSLIDARIIVAVGHGKVTFAMPELRKYITKLYNAECVTGHGTPR